MKKNLLCVLMLALLAGFGFSAQAQTKEERKDAKKEANARAIKDARKEAKQYRKEGYDNVPGDPPMEKQLEEAILLNYVKDDKGTKKYFTTTQMVKAENFRAAKEAAFQACLADIAAQIGSNIIGRIKQDVANAEDVKDATSINEVISAYQNTVAAKLGRTEPVVILQRIDKKTGLTHLTMVVKYDIGSAEEMVKKDLRKELRKKTQLLHDEIDELIGLKGDKEEGGE